MDKSPARNSLSTLLSYGQSVNCHPTPLKKFRKGQPFMLTAIKINNYKSIKNLELNPGRVNVFIGENGCGKSNILEAIALAAAAESYKLDNEFLASRGIRVTEPDLMRANFETGNGNTPIDITLSLCGIEKPEKYTLTHDNLPYSKWTYSTGEMHDLRRILENFLIFSPENTALRNFYKEGQIEPLGINGEGLLKLLKVINETSPEQMQIITDALQLFGWYDSVEIPSNINQHDDRIQISDRFLTQPFDQRSANEGFLFVLFYMALIVSDNTPKIFAVDNIDASLNPKMCIKLITLITELAEKFDKQVFLTTHNPAILDGLNLNDTNQKLFVVSRNKSGCTRTKTIDADKLPVSSTNEPMRLSEAFMRGYLGALPKGF